VSFVDREAAINTIAGDYLLKGINDATKIAKATGIPRKDVVLYIEEWRNAAHSSDAKARAEELLFDMDRAYDQIIQQLWVEHSCAEGARDAATILKTIAEVIAKRQDVLQKAGLYDDAALGDELAVAEEQMAGIKELLKVVAADFPETRTVIMEGLGRIFKQAVPIPVNSN
jgi:hypothetical protein